MVSGERDTDEFEMNTNREFNKNYDSARKEGDQGAVFSPFARRKFKRGMVSKPFVADEQAVKGFTFNTRYHKNTSQGRKTSVLDKYAEFRLSRRHQAIKQSLKFSK